jgi:serine/threonine protein kinase
MMLERGTLLNNRYRIVEVLGQGGMGSVYRAVDENLGVEVAVKDNLFTTEEYARQFRREASILASMRHPNLPRVTDHFVITGQGQYLVMDYIEGEDLRQRMERVGQVPEEEVIVIGAAVCDALNYLGSLVPPVIHRDIKPGNIKITPQGNIFLVDFGLAKTLEGTQATTTGARAMTPGYSPPEQYGTARTDQRSDIYSLGATLYAALTGAIPEDALARAMDQTELTTIRKHNSRVNRRIASVIEKALEVRPDDRYRTAAEFKQGLLNASSNSRRINGEYVVTPPPLEDKALLSDSALIQKFEVVEAESNEELPLFAPVSAPINGAQKRPSRPRKRSFRKFRLVALILIALGAAFLLYRYDPGLPNRAITIYAPLFSRYLPALAQPATTQTANTVTAATATSTLNPSPTLPSTSSAQETVEPTSLPVIISTATSTETPLPTNTPTLQPTPFGGGTGQIAFVSDISGIDQIYLINADGTGRVQITNNPEGACQPDWSPDGTRLVFISPCTDNNDYYPNAAMYTIKVDGTGMAPLPTVVGGDYDPEWSPDGTQIAFTSLRNSGHPQVFVLNLADNSVVTLSEKFVIDSQPSWSPDGRSIIFVTSRGNISELWVMDSNGKNRRQFSKNLAQLNLNPSFSPDGQTVLFTQYTKLGGVPRVMFAPLQFQNYVEYQVGKASLPMRNARYSPDGLWIVYEGWEVGGNHNIYIIAGTGAGRFTVTNDARLDFDPVWRPFLIP